MTTSDGLLIATNVLLVIITGWYAYTTSSILNESQKTGEDIKRLAEAAETSLRTLREQIEVQTGISRSMVVAAVQTSLRNIEHWMAANIMNLAAQHALPSEVNLVPDDASQVLEHARRISSSLTSHLASAFDNLRQAATQIETMRNAKGVTPQFFQQHTASAIEFLKLAKSDLDSLMQEQRSSEDLTSTG